MINYIVVSTFLIVFLLANYFFFYNLNYKKYFLKKKLIQRWSNEDCYLVGGTIIFLAIIFLQLFVSYFIKLNFFTFFKFIFIALFYLIGLYDDKYNLTGKFKLLIYFLIISFFIFVNFYENISYNFLSVSFLSIILFIIFVSIGIIDNIDGLLTSNFIIIILFYSLLLFSFEIYNHVFFLINLIFISIFFLFINLNKPNNYLGDSGSNLLASVLIILFSSLNNGIIIENFIN